MAVSKKTLKPKAPTLREELEDLLPADCITCGWGQPGPHAPNCKMGDLLARLDKVKE